MKKTHVHEVYILPDSKLSQRESKHPDSQLINEDIWKDASLFGLAAVADVQDQAATYRIYKYIHINTYYVYHYCYI